MVGFFAYLIIWILAMVLDMKDVTKEPADFFVFGAVAMALLFIL